MFWNQLKITFSISDYLRMIAVITGLMLFMSVALPAKAENVENLDDEAVEEQILSGEDLPEGSVAEEYQDDIVIPIESPPAEEALTDEIEERVEEINEQAAEGHGEETDLRPEDKDEIGELRQAIYEKEIQENGALVLSLTTPINHHDFSMFLVRYVLPNPDGSGSNRVLYGDVSEADRQALANYITKLTGLEISRHNPQEFFSYWVNLYNAAVINQILDHYPVASVRDIPDFFDNNVATVEGEDYSLNDIREKLRTMFRVPELHYVLSDGTVGGADLHYEALTPLNADQILRRGAFYFVSHPRAIHFNAQGKLRASKIYELYQDDFLLAGGPEGAAGVIDHIKIYADEPLKGELDQVDSIDEYFYDWSLNGWDIELASKQEQGSLWQRFLKMIGGNR